MNIAHQLPLIPRKVEPVIYNSNQNVPVLASSSTSYIPIFENSNLNIQSATNRLGSEQLNVLSPKSNITSPNITYGNVSPNINYYCNFQDEQRNGPDEIVLKDYQKKHFERCYEILKYMPFYMDGSTTGRGKTIILLLIAKLLGLSLIIFSPLGVLRKWKDEANKYGVPIARTRNNEYLCHTYDTLRGTKDKKNNGENRKRLLKHELLYREETDGKPQFTASTFLYELLQQGVMIIFDETQEVKNASADQTRAAKVLVQFVMNACKDKNCRSRMAFLSATLNDKPGQIVNYLKMVGFINSTKLYSKARNGSVKLEGIDDLYGFGKDLNPDKHEEFKDKVQFIAETKAAEQYVQHYFVEVIKPICMSIIPKTGNLLIEEDLYIALSKADDENYEKALTSLGQAVGYNPMTGETVMKKESIAEARRTLEMLELLKMKIIAYLVLYELSHKWFNKETGEEIFPKFVICASFKKVWDYWLQVFAKFNPLEISGRTSDERKRYEFINLFQQDNDNYRIIILNPSVSSGFDLHCKSGKRPRKMYQIPGFNVMEHMQTSGRIDREGIVDTQIVCHVFGISQGSTEASILKAINRKGGDVKKTHEEQNILFPGEFPKRIMEKIHPIVPSGWRVEFCPERWQEYKKYLEIPTILSPQSPVTSPNNKIMNMPITNNNPLQFMIPKRVEVQPNIPFVERPSMPPVIPLVNHSPIAVSYQQSMFPLAVRDSTFSRPVLCHAELVPKLAIRSDQTTTQNLVNIPNVMTHNVESVNMLRSPMFPLAPISDRTSSRTVPRGGEIVPKVSVENLALSPEIKVANTHIPLQSGKVILPPNWQGIPINKLSIN